MKNALLFCLLVFLFTFNSCQKCAIDDQLEVPVQMLRVLDQDGNNLLFGNTALYDPTQVQFIHEFDGELLAVADPQNQSLNLEFPITANQAENISLRLDSATSHQLTYNTLVYTNNQCQKEYTLSYVNLDGEQVCGSCGNTQFNPDRFINLRL